MAGKLSSAPRINWNLVIKYNQQVILILPIIL